MSALKPHITMVGSIEVNNKRMTKIFGDYTKIPISSGNNPIITPLLLNQLLNGVNITSVTINNNGTKKTITNFYCKEYYQGLNGTISEEGVLTTDDVIMTSIKNNDQYYRFSTANIIEFTV